jgi:acyl-phosphate glycerol 3-phosphate acyltransferase
MSDSPALEALLHNGFYGNLVIRELAAIVFAVLFGSIPVSPIVEWLFYGTDPRMLRTARALAPVVNTFKGLLPVLIASHGGGTRIGLLAAVAVVAGHCYCPWRIFRGGTGVAVTFGALCAVCWPAALAFLSVWLVAAIASDYAIVGSLLACPIAMVTLWYVLGAPGALSGTAIMVIVASRHRERFIRLSEDREPPLRQPRAQAVRRVAPAPQRSSIVIVDRQPV